MGTVRQQPRITIQMTKKFKDIQINLSKLKKLVKTVCARFNLLKATVSITLVDDAEIKRLNKQFLNRNSATDCLSFNLSDDDIESVKSFELVVNAERAVEQAALREHSSQAELALYVTHGLLHNLGFNDSSPRQAKKMHDTEDEILQQLGYGLVYNKALSGSKRQK
jgi:probable rRNA maturation factor